MKILLSSIGTRGDMEPFLAIGKLLQQKGHEVIYLFPEQFKTLVDHPGARFESLGPEFMKMLQSELGKTALGGSSSTWKKIISYAKLAKHQMRINKAMIRKQHELIHNEEPDRIVHSGKVIYPVIWETQHPGQSIMISPVPYLHYVKGHTHLAFHSNYGSFFNKLTYRLADWGLIKTIVTALKTLQITDVSKRQIKQALNEHKVIYTLSPTLFPRPKDWKQNLQILGYHERDKTVDWTPSSELTKFIQRHGKLLFVTFGSMTNPQPVEKTQIILDILERNRIPAIINTAAGGLAEPTRYNTDFIHFVHDIPYDWIFGQVYAIVHHGGSGTTHMALKHGCASMIVPHIIDQFLWNKIVHQLGAGPLGIKINNLSIQNLEPKLIELLSNPNYKKKAEQIAYQMNHEDLTERLYKEIIREDSRQ
ncbi:UDP-glucose--sterol glucosyltransferase [Reichenbachiella sp. 5M10]|uniref:glycosyltransferase n=1 Tax=Reichenbachiella sp. 5M10 TaxID=1889772 RepID=UPI000C14E55F|nr:glycosyltransferase [Reichenbachiella sp. 5M10]PIB34521.1 UDP-glucose--sterol glucosyltransferase [Reichenbachiella sp. 5M10]